MQKMTPYMYMQNRDDTVIEVVKKVREEKSRGGRELEELRGAQVGSCVDECN
jgi:hypothetical protein